MSKHCMWDNFKPANDAPWWSSGQDLLKATEYLLEQEISTE